jgi:alkanesulfonate monooxygenase SsuD/methylene tetrahydromethanopterin reductase-like flavin-dependent oxidoreductase (luciferase family)
VSNGRFLFGIGAGWNAEEMADHGVAFKDRWKVTRERVLAMQEIWTKEVAEFHGQFVNFDPLWCWPKPVQAGGPPVLIGAMSKWAIKRTAEYGDGWIPLDGGFDLALGLTELRTEAARVGRSMKEFDLSVITGYELAGVKGTEPRIRELMELGFNRILFLIEPGAPEKQWPVLERYANLIRTFR